MQRKRKRPEAEYYTSTRQQTVPRETHTQPAIYLVLNSTTLILADPPLPRKQSSTQSEMEQLTIINEQNVTRNIK